MSDNSGHPKLALILGGYYRHKLFLYRLTQYGAKPELVIVIRKSNLLRRIIRAFSSTLFSGMQSFAETIASPNLQSKVWKFFRTQQTHNVDNVNHPHVENLLRKVKPDLIFVYGSNIIKSQLLRIPGLWINAHGGVLPGYRGLDSNLWAIADDRVEFIGFSLHRILQRVDAGEILVSKRIELNNFTELALLRKEIAESIAIELSSILALISQKKRLIFRSNHLELSLYKGLIGVRQLAKILKSFLILGK